MRLLSQSMGRWRPIQGRSATDRAVDVAYNMAPFSTTDRMRPGFNRRSREVSKVTQDALESVVLLELYPRSKIRISIEIVSAEAGTRCVASLLPL